MRALVTGSAGFLGRHFVSALAERGYQVAEIDVGKPDAGDNALHVFAGWERGGEVFDLVVHCAAVDPHRAAIDGRPDHLAANLHLDSAMFEWALRTGQRRILYISSSAAYPVAYQASDQLRLREQDIDLDDPFAPDAGYGWLKLTGERMARDLNAAGVPVHVVRPFSGYGVDQGTDWPFGAFLARARAREDPFVVWGDGTQVRDWIHVSDVVAGALAVVDADERRPVNLCTGEGASMLQLADLVTRAAGYRPRITPLTGRPTGVRYRVGDSTRMREIYTPKVHLEDAVGQAFAGLARARTE